jgi:hypothetical protein
VVLAQLGDLHNHTMAWLHRLDHHAGALQAIFAGFILVATVAYVCVTRRLSRIADTQLRIADTQLRDQRAIQRAYVSAEPEGLHPLLGEKREGHFLLAHVNFRNGGHIPARNFRWYLTIACDANKERRDFPVPDTSAFEGTTIIAPGGIQKFGTDDIRLADTGWIYVWGAYTYDDGFESNRYARFCHRYNRESLRKLDHRHEIPATDARLHHFGNEEVR